MTSTARPTWSRKSRGSSATTRSRRPRSIARPASPSRPRPASQLIERRVRRTAAARGLDEAVTWSFISRGRSDAFGGGDWRLANPISEDMKVMRPSLLPGPDRRGAPQPRPRRVVGPAVRARPPLSRRRRASDAVAAARRRQARRAAGSRARRRRSTRSTPRPKCWRCSRRPARRSPTCSSSPTPDRPGTRAARRRSASAPRRSLAALRRASPAPAEEPRRAGRARSRPKSTSTRSRRRASSGRARAAFAPPALQAVTRDFAFIVPADLAADALVRAIRGADKAAITGVAAVRPVRERATACRWRSKSRSSRARRASPTTQIGEISKRIVAAAEKLGARLRS